MPEHISLAVNATGNQVLPLRLTADVPAGSLLRIRTDCAPPLSQAEVVSLRVAGSDEKIPCIRKHSNQDFEESFGRTMGLKSWAVFKPEKPLDTGTFLHVIFCQKTERRRGCQSNPELFTPYAGIVWCVDAGITDDVLSTEFNSVSGTSEIEFISSDPAYLEAVHTVDNQLRIRRYDTFGNPVPFANSSVTLDDGNSTTALTIPNEMGKSDADIPQEMQTSQHIRVLDANGMECSALPRPVIPDGTPVFFGEIHWHSVFSADGVGALEAGLTRSRDEMGHDFTAAADHAGSPDHFRSPEWSYQRFADVCQSFDRPGRFITIPGAEYSQRWGHCNLYADSWDLWLDLLEQWSRERPKDLEKYSYSSHMRPLSTLGPAGRSLVIPHHTNTNSYSNSGFNGEDGLPCWCAMRFPLPPMRGGLRLIEMLQTRGCFETEYIDPLWHVADGGYGGSVRTALGRDYRLGFIGGTDNHSSWPTRGGNGLPCSLTAIQTDSLDLPSLFSALHARQCYATTGARIVADVRLNNQPMGSELKLHPTDERRFRIHVRGTAPLVAVEIIHHGITLHSFLLQSDNADLDVEWVDDRPGRLPADCYYYVRIRQEDGHCAWLSPFWIDLAEEFEDA